MMMQSWQDNGPATLQGPAILDDMKERAKIFADPFRLMFESIPEGTTCWHNRLTYWIPRPWDNRNSTVTMIGDAAHPMTFHRGQGLNNAVLDVASLAQLLSEKGTAVSQDGSDSAISLYEQSLWERGKEAVLSSLQNTVMTHNWEMMSESPLLKSGLQKPEAAPPEPEPEPKTTEDVAADIPARISARI